MIIAGNGAPDVLIFTRYPMLGAAPVSTLFSTDDPSEVCGIYVLEFTNGHRYVGKTVNIVARYSTHERHHGDLVAFKFAPCPAELLDHYERTVIKHEQQNQSLRNLLLTDWPGGQEDLKLSLAEGTTVQLPWERGQRKTVASESKTSPEHRFWDLSNRTDYARIRTQLARFIHETIPDPMQTKGVLWSLTALPSTSKTRFSRRLFTLNAGSMEVLFLKEWDLENGATELEWTINTWPEDTTESLETLKGDWLENAEYEINDKYKSVGTVVTIRCIGTEVFAKALDQDLIIEGAYRLNVTMMRRAKSIFAKHHNQAFAADTLSAIHNLNKDLPELPVASHRAPR